MISIRQTLDSFEVFTDRGMITAVGIPALIKVIEKEFNIDVYDLELENKVSEFDDKLEEYGEAADKLKSTLQDLNSDFLMLKQKVKEAKS